MEADKRAAEAAGAGRRVRVPYEWVLGAMFVGTFYIARWMDSWVFRGIWLVLVMPVACTSLRVKRRVQEPSPVFGLLLLTATIGWLYIVMVYVLIEYKREIDYEAVVKILDFTRWTWPIPPLLSFSSLVLAAVRRGRYREFGVFANAALLLAFAWVIDSAYSPR